MTDPTQTPDSNPYAAPGTDTAPRENDEILAGRGARLAAVIIDGLLQFAIVFPMMWFSGSWSEAMKSGGQLGFTATVVWFLVGAGIFLALQGWLLFTRQQTIGKMLLGIRIVGTDDTYVPPGRIYGLRYLLFQVIAQFPFVNFLLLVDALMIFRRDRRCLHDLAAGTRVVEAPAGS